ncbi:alpha,alpha-trehalase TreA [Flaviaesturariibacter flavus]|uniref:Alpha,alpha-trehalase TreA n=2 Tax=Flaviaesturariibacter flavus TaxID=2502780 RepID=A0A4R1BCA6_9BACT|nr:alpha,alpha-trehalase TreA [Flaviaesturariibacter flavus]
MAQKTPDQIYGRLFEDVQLAHIFPDSKTFVDALPRYSAEHILQAYEEERERPGFHLMHFVTENFHLPQKPISDYETTETDAEKHINRLWHVLHRKADTAAEGSSLLPLPHEYIVPGGRFREIYYWDSYFTMLGLRESGEDRMIESMVKNFAWLIDRYGHIPNGNRTYYLSRSQPPFFSLMVELLAGIRGDRIYTDYLPQLQREYSYWIDSSAPTQHVVKLADGSILNRYWDQLEIPRQEAWAEDVMPGRKHHADSAGAFYRDLRSAAESGWDFSSRWFADGKNLHSIRTTRILPVDLNCLLYHLEQTIAKGLALKGMNQTAQRYAAAAAARHRAILKHFWSPRTGWFMDYDLDARRTTQAPTLAGMFPFFLGLADKSQLRPARTLLQKQFLKAGGVVTTLRFTKEQWDAPNGWAPLQWVTVIGLDRYRDTSLARTVATRWVKLNLRVFRQTGKLTEKYDVVHADKEGGGGEYPTQDGFGWTNGVLLALMKKYNLK